MIKRIIVTGDSRRPILDQVGNITRFYYTIKAQLERLTFVKPELLVTHDRFEDVNDWLKTYNNEYKDERPWIADATDLTDTLVLSFEMPYNSLYWLNKNNIPYIDFITYPLNLWSGLDGDNPVYGVNCNYKKNTMIFLDRYETTKQANLLRAKYARKDQIPIPENTALIVGQTPIDRSLINKNGKVLTMNDYEDNIRQIVDKYDLVVFRPHPNDWEKKKNTSLMLKLGCSRSDDFYTVYDYLSEPKISHVYSISSSVLTEAEYFEKKITAFDNNYRNRIFFSYVPVFWKEIQKDYWLEGVLC